MPSWQDQLADHLEHRRENNLLRALHSYTKAARLITAPNSPGLPPLINFASNDYLALATHPQLIKASQQAAETLGVGAGASRLVTGHLQIHHTTELAFAKFKHTEAALLFPTGYMANLATITSLADNNTTLFLDKLNHASLIDAARAASNSGGATVRVYPHNDLNKLARLLERTPADHRKIIITDTVFSMDGDLADLPALCDLRDHHNAILIIDEAHATGVLGQTGAGLAELQSVTDRIDVTISTASKALGSLGGIVTASKLIIDTLINNARPFIYTTAIPPTQAATIAAALDVIRDEPERRFRLAQLNTNLRSALDQHHWHVPHDLQHPIPIIPLITHSESAALELSQKLQNQGLLCPAIRPPTVPPNSSRLRITLRADHHDNDLDKLIDVLGNPPNDPPHPV